MQEYEIVILEPNRPGFRGGSAGTTGMHGAQGHSTERADSSQEGTPALGGRGTRVQRRGAGAEEPPAGVRVKAS